MLNILAPGVVTDHISGGFSWNYTHNTTVDFAVVYAPQRQRHRTGIIPGLGLSPALQIELSMSQLQLTGGLTYHFDTPAVVIAQILIKAAFGSLQHRSLPGRSKIGPACL